MFSIPFFAIAEGSADMGCFARGYDSFIFQLMQPQPQYDAVEMSTPRISHAKSTVFARTKDILAFFDAPF